MSREPVPVIIGDDEPIRLAEACERFFGGRITPATLRAEYRRGNLTLLHLGNKDLVKPSAIREMEIKCQRTCGSDQQGETSLASSPRRLFGLSSKDESTRAHDALEARLNKLSGRSPTTSPKSVIRTAASATLKGY